MRKNRLLLLVNVSVIALSPLAYAQTTEDASSDGVTKQQLEQFLTPKEPAFETHEAEVLAATDELATSPAGTEIIPPAAPTPAQGANKPPVSPKTPTAEGVKQVVPAAVQPAASSAGIVTTPSAVAPEAAQAQTAPKEEVKQPEKPNEVKALAAEAQTPPAAVHEEAPHGENPAEAHVEVHEEAAHAEEHAPTEKPAAVTSPAEHAEKPVEHTEAAPTAVHEEVHAEHTEAPAHEEEPAHKEAPAAVKEKQEEESSLDTIDIEEGGNWLLKRKALDDTVRKIEKINILYDDIRDTNLVFLQGMNTVDVLFTQFTYEVGLDLGRVDQLVQDVANHLAQEREDEGDLSEEERELLHKAEERKKDIEQLQANIQDVLHIHAQIKEARSLDEEQIIESDSLRKTAWHNFRMIERVLNEEKAEELYHNTVQNFETMQSAYRYLQTRLIPHFQQSIKTLQEKIQEVKKQAEQLQQQGILLKKEAIDLDRKEHAALLETEVSVAEPEAQPVGWFGSIKNMLWAPFGALGSLWNWITGSSENMNQYLPDEAQEEESKVQETHHPEEL